MDAELVEEEPQIEVLPVKIEKPIVLKANLEVRGVD
jgi:hypothetical protein